MTRTGLVVVLAAACGVGAAFAAPQSKEPVDAAAIAKIRDEGLNRSQVGAYFNTLVDDIGPRLAGSPQYKRAAEWARDTLTNIGLTGSRIETFEFGRGWQLDKFTIEMVEPRYMPLLGYPEAWSPSTSGEIVAPVVFVAGKTGPEVAKLTLKNGAVLQAAPVTNFIVSDRLQPAREPDAPPPDPNAPGRGGNPGRQGGGGRQAGPPDPNAPITVDQAIRQGGAAVLLRPSRGMHGTVFVQAGRDNPNDALPKIVLAGEQYNMIARMAQRGIAVKLRVNVQARFLDQDRNQYNVLAEIPGSDPALRSQIVMLGAHLDSWHTGTGATDNADGSAVVMEAFRILKAAGLQPRRTLRVALWGAEEEGLLGSRAWVRRHVQGEGGEADRDKVSVYFNIDPGKGPIYGWYLQGNAEARPIFDAWMAPFKDLGYLKNVQNNIGSTDHLSFINAGVPGFNPIQDYVDYDVREHHTNADTSERIKEQDLKQNAVILASMIYHAAMRTEQLPSAVRR
jgi:carboxypeptidase Q